jgi:glutamate synthase domain-containing protein 3
MESVMQRSAQNSPVQRSPEPVVRDGMVRLDVSSMSVREINEYLHHRAQSAGVRGVQILNPDGQHNLAVGLDLEIDVEIVGHAGYFIGGMNKRANITVHGNVGWSVAENIMSGTVRVKGFASECAAASGHGGLVVIEGDASSRCGISMKGVDIVVGGSVGHMSAFMAQAGTLLICGDAAAALGDSIYEAVIYVSGKIHSLGADAREEPMTTQDHDKITRLLKQAQINADLKSFKRVASGRTLYHWNVEADQEY